VLSFTIYRRFFTEGLTGYGSAMSVVVLCVLALVIVLAQSFSRRWEAVS
jgi:multiple sugar transport system permease protein